MLAQAIRHCRKAMCSWSGTLRAGRRFRDLIDIMLSLGKRGLCPDSIGLQLCSSGRLTKILRKGGSPRFRPLSVGGQGLMA